jgi:hypothetical protein
LTTDRDGGEYYKAYFDLISDIHPKPDKTRAITPHINRWWHVVTYMPDLDDENQVRQENDIFAALFWCLLAKSIDLYDIDTEHPQYRVNSDELKIAGEDYRLVVSNGTMCDHLYEVLDALSIYPELVENILSRVAELTRQDMYEGKEGYSEDTMLANCLSSFRLKEYPLGEKDEVRSILDLPLLLKRSTTTDAFEEEYVLRILKVMFAEVRKYLANLCNAKERPEVMRQLLLEQFELFLKGVAIDEKSYKDIYNDFLFAKICSGVQAEMEDLGFRGEAITLKKRVEELKKK